MGRGDAAGNQKPAPADYESGPDAGRRAAAGALARLEHARSVVLVEGVSDQIAVETLAVRQGRNLAQEGVVVVPLSGAHAIGHALTRLKALDAEPRLSGLCDASEAEHVGRALVRAGRARPSAPPALRPDLARAGFFVCERDLEDELLRALGAEAFVEILAEDGDLGAFRTLQKQTAWRDRPVLDQARRFLGAGADRKLRYAQRLGRALPLDHLPRPLQGVLSRA